jgi:hypothetical protein
MNENSYFSVSLETHIQIVAHVVIDLFEKRDDHFG